MRKRRRGRRRRGRHARQPRRRAAGAGPAGRRRGELRARAGIERRRRAVPAQSRRMQGRSARRAAAAKRWSGARWRSTAIARAHGRISVSRWRCRIATTMRSKPSSAPTDRGEERRGRREFRQFRAASARRRPHVRRASLCTRSIFPSRPSLAGHNDYAFALLTAGRLVEGWNQYEFRWMRAPLLQLRPGFDRPVWAGQDLAGKVDPAACRTGLRRHHPVRPLRAAGQGAGRNRSAAGSRRTRTAGARIRGHRSGPRSLRSESLPHFDFYINLPSLPRVFGTDARIDSGGHSVPAREPADVARWAVDGSVGRASQGRNLLGGKPDAFATIDFARWICRC